MDPGAIISIILFLLLLICGIAAILLVIKAVRDAGSSSKVVDIPNNPSVFKILQYSDAEWGEIYKREFLLDPKGTRFLDNYSNVIKIDSCQHPLVAPTIFFLPHQIYLSDGRAGKLFNLIDINDNGFGTWLYSVEAIKFDGSSGLRIRGESISGVPGAASTLRFPLDYVIPLPATDEPTLTSLVDKYSEIIETLGSPKK